MPDIYIRYLALRCVYNEPLCSSCFFILRILGYEGTLSTKQSYKRASLVATVIFTCAQSVADLLPWKHSLADLLKTG